MPRLAPVIRTALLVIVMSTAPSPVNSALLITRPGDIDQPDSRKSSRAGRNRTTGLAAAGFGRSQEARLAAEKGDELVTGAGRTRQPNRVGEQPRSGFRGDE